MITGHSYLTKLFDKKYILTLNYGQKITYKGKTWYHDGLDFGTPVGTKIKAIMRGTALKYDVPSGGLGVQFDNGLYGWIYHTSRYLVDIGDIFESGQDIALSGKTGLSTGPHTHFQMQRKLDYYDINLNPKIHVNPTNYIIYQNTDMLTKEDLMRYVPHLYFYCLGRHFKPEDDEGKYWIEDYVGKSFKEFFDAILSQPEFIANEYWKEKRDIKYANYKQRIKDLETKLPDLNKLYKVIE